MNSLGLELKLVAKKIVTNSNFLSSIRRKYRYESYKSYYKKMQVIYNTTNYGEQLSKLKNIHSGERCFIVGNGPSLTADDLEKIKNEFSFAFNRIYLIYEKTEWRPTFYMCQDRQLLRSVADYYGNCDEKVILGYSAKYEFNIDVTNAMYYLLDSRDSNRIVTKLGFSEVPDKYVIDGGSVTYSAIQMAVYMGFSEIYLLGIDHNFSHTLDKNRRIISHDDVKKDYFDDRYKEAFKQFEEKGKVYAAPDKQLMDLAFEATKEYCDKKGVVIRNATRGGKLEIFPRVNLDELL